MDCFLLSFIFKIKIVLKKSMGKQNRKLYLFYPCHKSLRNYFNLLLEVSDL